MNAANSPAALLVDTREAARLLCCSAGHVRNLIARGDLRYSMVGGARRFSVDDLQAFIGRQRQGVAQ